MSGETPGLDRVWDLLTAGTEAPPGFQVGPLCVWIREWEGDLLLSMQRRPAEEGQKIRLLEAPPEEDAEWRRVGAWEERSEMELLPSFPDRPVVVRPEMAFTLLPGERIQLYVGVPILLTLRRKDEPPFFSEPVLPFSNTWFGTPVEGELSYALRAQARRNSGQVEACPWRVICPVRVRNQSKEILSLQRLCLRLRYLSIYTHAERGLWANESSVIFRGGDQWSRVAYAQNAPAELDDPQRWVKGEEDPQGTFLQRAITQGKGFLQ